MKKVVFVGLRGFGVVLVKPNKNATLSVCHYFRRLLKRATASTEPGTSAIANSDTLDSTLPLMLKRATASSLRARQRQSGAAKAQANRRAVSLDQDRLQDWRKPNPALRRTARAHFLAVEASSTRGRC